MSESNHQSSDDSYDYDSYQDDNISEIDDSDDSYDEDENYEDEYDTTDETDDTYGSDDSNTHVSSSESDDYSDSNSGATYVVVQIPINFMIPLVLMLKE